MNGLKLAGVVGLALLVSACSQPYGMGHGPGAGGGYGPGPGPGGMGPGTGTGMMGGGAYGPGAGYGGMGPGMMGGGPGMGGMGGMHHEGLMWGLARLDLSSEQRASIAKIQGEFDQRRWDLMRAMHAQGGQHQRMFDEQGERRSYEAMAALHKQMFDAHLDARKRILEVLTPQQREQLSSEGQKK